MILDDIVAAKNKRLENLMAEKPLHEIIMAAEGFVPVRNSFKSAIERGNDISIIGEIKKASPSKGVICENFNPVELAREYAKSDVQALSVLTEQDFFCGSDEYLCMAKEVSGLPVLRKDFIINVWQIYEAYLLGADAILLIMAILDAGQLKEYLSLASQLGMDALVEAHDKDELSRALDCGAQMIGINNRNLKNFTVSLDTTLRLVPLIPGDKIIVSESGIHTCGDVNMMRQAGVDALLIGESLMQSGNIQRTVSTLRRR